MALIEGAFCNSLHQVIQRFFTHERRQIGNQTGVDLPGECLLHQPLQAFLVQERRQGSQLIAIYVRALVLIYQPTQQFPSNERCQQSKLVYRIVPKPVTPEDLRTQVELAIADVLYMGALEAYRQLTKKK